MDGMRFVGCNVPNNARVGWTNAVQYREVCRGTGCQKRRPYMRANLIASWNNCPTPYFAAGDDAAGGDVAGDATAAGEFAIAAVVGGGAVLMV